MSPVTHRRFFLCVLAWNTISAPPALLKQPQQAGFFSQETSASLPRRIISYLLLTRWPSNAAYYAAALLLILVQALFIVVLLWQRRRARRVDNHLSESEKRFRLLTDTTPALVWMSDRKGVVTFVNNKRFDLDGHDLAAGLGDVWSAHIHPDDLQGVKAADALALKKQEGFSKEYRLRRRDGVYRWILDVATSRVNADGSFAGFIGSAVDITDQKLSREALERIGGKLIGAQEEERRRIARELHDDICQRLAILAMELEQAGRPPKGSKGGPNPVIEKIRQHCAEIADDVQSLSHKLHSSKLEYLGLVSATRGFCDEFRQQHDVKLDFAEEDVPGVLPRAVSLSLFRITQEALHNAVKHSGVEYFTVALRGTADEIRLEVIDHGVGFDMEKAREDPGLGLISMQERVHLVHGTLSIESHVGSGTRVFVRVPLAKNMEASATSAEAPIDKVRQ